MTERILVINDKKNNDNNKNNHNHNKNLVTDLPLTNHIQNNAEENLNLTMVTNSSWWSPRVYVREECKSSLSADRKQLEG